MDIRDLVIVNPVKEAGNYLITALFAKGLRIPAGQQGDFEKAVRNECKAFGGNLFNLDDQQRASGRALKFINLGLEHASTVEMRTGQEIGEIFDRQMAENILLNAPVLDIYALGKKYFEQDQEHIRKFLAGTTVKIDGMYFHLISASDYKVIEGNADIELSKGTIKEHHAAKDLIVKFMKVWPLAQLLPISESGSILFQGLGSKKESVFTSEKGLLEIFLLSLIVACMFRKEKELLFSSLDVLNLEISGRHAKEAIMEAEIHTISTEEAMRRIQHANKLREVIKNDFLARRGSKDGNRLNQKFLTQIFFVSLSEIKQFSDLLFFEPKKFGERAGETRGMFLKYFVAAEELLGLKVGKSSVVAGATLNAFQFVAERITQEVSEFYKTVPDVDFSNAEVAKFWHQRIFLKTRDENESMAQKAREGIDPEKITESSLENIIEATKYFRLWPTDKQQAFMEKLHVPRFVHETNTAELLLRFLKNVSAKVSTEEARGASGEVSVYYEQINWSKIVLNRLTWENVHASIVCELWQGGTDEIRDIVFEQRAKFKITWPAIKKYYLFEHGDLRLLQYVLDEAVSREIVRTKSAWEEMLRLSENMGVVKTIVQIKHREVAK